MRDSYYSSSSIRTIRNLLMERVAKRRLTDLVVGVSLRHQQVAEDYLTAIAQVANRLVAVVIYKRNKTTPARIQRADKPQASSTSSTDGWTVGMKVSHKKMGEQEPLSALLVKGDRQELDVAFAGMGIKRLLASFAPIEKIENRG